MQLAAPAREKVPAAHAAQLVALLGAYAPASQDVQFVARPADHEPAAHATQADALAGAHVPAVHGEQLEAFAGAYVPAEQPVQVKVPVADHEPGAHTAPHLVFAPTVQAEMEYWLGAWQTVHCEQGLLMARL